MFTLAQVCRTCVAMWHPQCLQRQKAVLPAVCIAEPAVSQVRVCPPGNQVAMEVCALQDLLSTRVPVSTAPLVSKRPTKLLKLLPLVKLLHKAKPKKNHLAVQQY